MFIFLNKTFNVAHSSNSNVTLFLLMLQKHYGKNLLPFECHFERGGVDPAPILAQVEAQSKKKGKGAQQARPPSPGSQVGVQQARPPSPGSQVGVQQARPPSPGSQVGVQQALDTTDY